MRHGHRGAVPAFCRLSRYLIIVHLHIDGIIFSLQQHGGISVYFREVLSRLQPEHQATLTLEAPLQQSLDPALFPGVNCEHRIARPFERLRSARAIGGAATVFHSSYYRRPALRAQPTVVTVHDFVHQHFAPELRDRMRGWLINSAIRKANHIVCVSEATRQDLMEFVPLRCDQHVTVIHNGASDQFRPLASSPSFPSQLERPFALFVGQRGGYKNFSLALKALEQMPDFELRCVGGGPLRASELACVSERTRSRVRHLGFVDEKALNGLYNQAFCLLYPSSYEGFGIPVIEAMRAGCPVVSIPCKAVLEVGGRALSVSEDPTDAASLVRAIYRLQSSETRAQLRAVGLAQGKSFSWDRCFIQLLAVYRSF